MMEILKECLIYFVYKHSGRIGRTKLFKLVYLSDVLSYAKRGKTITGIDYVYYDYGPWSPLFYDALDLTKGIIQERVSLTSRGDPSYIYRTAAPRYRFEHLSEEDLEILKQIDTEWGNRSLRAVLSAVYSSPPFADAKYGDTLDFDKISQSR